MTAPTESEDVALDPSIQARVGAVLRGKYRVDRVLGVGGMAVVYAATHRNRQRFAIKMLHPELSIRQEIRTRFLREGYVANSVEHRGAVKVLDDDIAEDGAAFLVMELLEGKGAEQLWEERGGRLEAAVVLAIGHQLLDVLAAAHANGVVHRDIKPANLFVTREGALKVLDFGIARLREATDGHSTGTGVVLGTPAFMAPEQALGRSSEIDGQTDVWAVGATLFSLLSGANVHLGQSAQELMVRAATRPARSLAAALPNASPRVVALVDRALAFEKTHRWASAAAMRDAVRDAYLAEFSTFVSEGPLVALFEQGGPKRDPGAHARTIPSDAPPPRQAAVGVQAPAVPRVPTEYEPPQGGQAYGGPTTGVASAHTVPGARRSGRLWQWLAAAGVAVVAAVAVVAGVMVVNNRAAPHAPATASSPELRVVGAAQGAAGAPLIGGGGVLTSVSAAPPAPEAVPISAPPTPPPVAAGAPRLAPGAPKRRTPAAAPPASGPAGSQAAGQAPTTDRPAANVTPAATPTNPLQMPMQ